MFDRISTNKVKFLVGDFNAKIRQKLIQNRPLIGKHSLREKSNDNGIRLINCAMIRNMKE
jgi:hypothetical protein